MDRLSDFKPGGHIVIDLDAKNWNPKQFFQHPNENHAVEEAKRLAEANPGHHFCVYEPICVAIRQAPVTVTYFEKEPPF